MSSMILEYAQATPNKYIMSDATIRYREANRVCADVIEVFLKIKDDTLADFSFDGYMSIIATGCSGIIGESLVWQSLDEILAHDESYVKDILQEEISPRRRNASLIGLLAVKNAIHTYRDDSQKEDFSDIMID